MPVAKVQKELFGPCSTACSKGSRRPIMQLRAENGNVSKEAQLTLSHTFTQIRINCTPTHSLVTRILKGLWVLILNMTYTCSIHSTHSINSNGKALRHGEHSQFNNISSQPVIRCSRRPSFLRVALLHLLHKGLNEVQQGRAAAAQAVHVHLLLLPGVGHGQPGHLLLCSLQHSTHTRALATTQPQQHCRKEARTG